MLVRDDLDVLALDEVFAVLVEPRDDRLRVEPAAEDYLVAGRGVLTAIGVVAVAVAEHLDLDVAARLGRPAVELDADVARNFRTQPQRVVVRALRRQHAVRDTVAVAARVPHLAGAIAIERVLPPRRDRRRVADLASGDDERGESECGPHRAQPNMPISLAR